MYEKEYSSIKSTLTEELFIANSYIDKVESYTAITAPESPLGIILPKQKDSDIRLQRTYAKKRKLMNFLDQLTDIKPFLCSNCNNIIEIERLLLMPNASFCAKCVSN